MSGFIIHSRESPHAVTHSKAGVCVMTNSKRDFSTCGPGDLVLANRILFKYGVVDGFGHVSLRCQDNPEQFWLARNCAPSLVGIDDIIRHDLDGETVEDVDHRLYLERFIHAAAFQGRDDICAVVHSHSCSMVAFSVSKVQQLVPVWHMAGSLAGMLRYLIPRTSLAARQTC